MFNSKVVVFLFLTLSALLQNAKADVRVGDSATTQHGHCSGSYCVKYQVTKTITGVRKIGSSYSELLYKVEDGNGKLLETNSTELAAYLKKEKLLSDIPTNCGGELYYGYPQLIRHITTPAGDFSVCETSTLSDAMISIGNVPFFDIQMNQEFKDCNGYPVKESYALVSYKKGTGEVISE